jgi:hypothetical protein
VLFLFGCVQPAQPALSAKEKSFISKLNGHDSWHVNRHIEVTILGRFDTQEKRGGYGLELKYDDCDNLLDISFNKETIRHFTDSLAF